MQENPEGGDPRAVMFCSPSAEGIMARLDTSAADFYSVEYVAVVDSTNNIAKRLASGGCPAGRVIVADGQTAGRGRLGRSFYSPRGSGLYISIVLRPGGMMAKPELITTAAAVAVCRAIDSLTGIKPAIKWVNDVQIDGKKVCGILTEGGASPSGALDWAVLGIGINLIEPEGGFPPDIAAVAGALFTAGSPDGDLPPADFPERMAAAILNHFAQLYVSPSANSDTIVQQYKSLCTTPGRRVTVTRGLTRRQALALLLDDALRLVVRYDDGTEEVLACGEVSVRPDDG